MFSSQAKPTPSPSPTPMEEEMEPPIIPSMPPMTPIPTHTPLPTKTPTITPTATPSVPITWPKDQPVYCRFGPGTGYLAIGALELGQSAEIAGRNADGTWWYIRNPADPYNFCWVSLKVTHWAGNLTIVPIVPTPAASVTNVKVNIDPPSMTVPCASLPQVLYIRAKITTNGPASVTWRWETSAGNSANVTTLFIESGAQTVEYQIHAGSAGDYLAKLRVISPNGKVGRAEAHVACTP